MECKHLSLSTKLEIAHTRTWIRMINNIIITSLIYYSGNGFLFLSHLTEARKHIVIPSIWTNDVEMSNRVFIGTVADIGTWEKSWLEITYPDIRMGKYRKRVCGNWRGEDEIGVKVLLFVPIKGDGYRNYLTEYLNSFFFLEQETYPED